MNIEQIVSTRTAAYQARLASVWGPVAAELAAEGYTEEQIFPHVDREVSGGCASASFIAAEVRRKLTPPVVVAAPERCTGRASCRCSRCRFDA